MQFCQEMEAAGEHCGCNHRLRVMAAHQGRLPGLRRRRPAPKSRSLSASGSLDSTPSRSLCAQGAPIGSFGVGINLPATPSPHGGVTKLSAVRATRRTPQRNPVIELSGRTSKRTIQGVSILRFLGDVTTAHGRRQFSTTHARRRYGGHEHGTSSVRLLVLWPLRHPRELLHTATWARPSAWASQLTSSPFALLQRALCTSTRQSPASSARKPTRWARADACRASSAQSLSCDQPRARSGSSPQRDTSGRRQKPRLGVCQRLLLLPAHTGAPGRAGRVLLEGRGCMPGRLRGKLIGKAVADTAQGEAGNLPATSGVGDLDLERPQTPTTVTGPPRACAPCLAHMAPAVMPLPRSNP